MPVSVFRVLVKRSRMVVPYVRTACVPVVPYPTRFLVLPWWLYLPSLWVLLGCVCFPPNRYLWPRDLHLPKLLRGLRGRSIFRGILRVVPYAVVVGDGLVYFFPEVS